MSINETKNTTILAMDVVGYSAKMNEDERGTTEKLKTANTSLGDIALAHVAFRNVFRQELISMRHLPLYPFRQSRRTHTHALHFL